MAPEDFLIPEYSVVAEDLGARVGFVELREAAIWRGKDGMRVVVFGFAVQTIEGVRVKLRTKIQ